MSPSLLSSCSSFPSSFHWYSVGVLSTGVLISTVAAVWIQYKRSQKRDNLRSHHDDGKDDDNNNNKRKGVQRQSNKRTNNSNIPESQYTIYQTSQQMQRELLKEKRRQNKIKHLAMKRIMYDNISMLCPQQEKLCTISQRKANWYVDKQLAHWINECTIQLKFEPKNRSS